MQGILDLFQSPPGPMCNEISSASTRLG